MKYRIAFLIATSLAGFLTLAFFAVIQRRILGLGFISDPRAFIVPFVYGATIGLWLGLRHLRIRRDEAELQATVGKLQATEEMLLQQIDEYCVTHQRLLASERCLQEQNDELLATEERLREQIRESEENRRLLQESNRNLQTMFDVSPLAMVITSYPGDVIRTANHRFCNDFGYPLDTVIGKTSQELGIWDDDEFDLFLQSLENQGLSGYNAEINTYHGEKRSVALYSSAIDYRNEQCLLVVYMDVTDQKRMEEIISQTQKMEVIGQLAGGVAHDYNNMLSAIMASAELLSGLVQDDPAAAKYISTILEAANRSADLTNQLLVFSRKKEKQQMPVSIHDTIRSVIAMLERTIDKSISLETRLSADNDRTVGDQTLLQNALLNLGVNARDAMPHGGTITFATSNVNLDAAFGAAHGDTIVPGPFLEIAVSDTGSGMPADTLEHIFEPFFTTKEIGKGTGLGLAAVYGTVKQHRGCLSVQSTPGIGTILKLYIPTDETGIVVKSEKGTAERGTGGILLVDDEMLVRTSGKALLEEMGYTVFVAEGGKQALEIYSREKDNIMVVLLDMVMPQMGGKETLASLTAAFPDVRVVISSGFQQEGTAEELLRLGARGFIHKPYTKHDLFRAVSAALQQ